MGVGRRVPALAVMSGALVGAGFALGIAMGDQQAPAAFDAASQSAADEEPWRIDPSEFVDSTPVVIQPIIQEPQEYLSPGEGTLTRLICGVEATSGASLASIDGKPVLIVATAMPLWRDISPGTKGADVEGLQRELNRLGADVVVDGQAGEQTLNALQELFVMAGESPNSAPRGLPFSRVIWASPDMISDLQCSPQIALGSKLNSDSVLFQTGTALASVSLSPTSSLMIDGERVLRVGGESVPVGPGLEPDLRILESTDAYRQWLATGGDIEMTGRLELVTPIMVAAVPPSAVVAGAAEACVYGVDGQAYRVEIVASEAGQTVVRADPSQQLPPEIATRPGSQTSCQL